MIKSKMRLKNCNKEVKRKTLSGDKQKPGRIENHCEKVPKKNINEEIQQWDDIYDETPCL